jgi:DNA-binding transcriptional MerR regulator
VPDDAYSINDLSRLTGLSVRTIRYYLAQGLIPASGESGPGAHYGQGHLDRLRLIKRLQTQYLPNAEIRRRLAPLSDQEVAGLLEEQGDASSEPDRGSALDYIRNLLGTATPGGPARVPAAPAHAAPAFPPAPDDTPVRRGPSIAPEPPPLFKAASRLALTSVPPISMPSMAASAPDGITAERRSSATKKPNETSPQPERSQWERLTLADNIELHIRRPLSRIEQRRVERLITIARQVLTEDQS